MKRILLLVITNLAVVTVLGLVWNILDASFGLTQKMMAMGLPAGFGYIAVMSLALGFGGAFISLWMSKGAAKRSMGVHVIETPTTREERWLVNVVKQQADKLGLKMPEVGIFHGAPNAFATGARKNDALVAVSTGLLETMSSDEVEAVLGHEMAHVANGDMVTQTLLQGVLNTFVIFFSRVIAHLVNSVLSGNRDGEQNSSGSYGMTYFAVSMVAQMLLGFLASMIVMWFSRYREFHADKGGAALAGREKMIASLRRLQSLNEPEDLPGEMAAFGISGKIKGGFEKLFSTHPPLEERISALQNKRY